MASIRHTLLMAAAVRVLGPSAQRQLPDANVPRTVADAKTKFTAEPIKRVGLGIYNHEGIAADDVGSNLED